MANPDIPLCDLASLNWVSHRVPSSPALGLERERKKKREVLQLFRCYTHTHDFVTHNSCVMRSFLTHSIVTLNSYTILLHTCSETSYRITDVECIVRAKNIPVKPDRRNWLTRRERQCEENLSMSLQKVSNCSDAAHSNKAKSWSA